MERTYTIPGLFDAHTVKSDHHITSIRVLTQHGHDHVTVFNRGAGAGTLVMKVGDGKILADKLKLIEDVS